LEDFIFSGLFPQTDNEMARQLPHEAPAVLDDHALAATSAEIDAVLLDLGPVIALGLATVAAADNGTSRILPTLLLVVLPLMVTALPTLRAVPSFGAVMVDTGFVASVDWIADTSPASSVPG
jgi:hypothetical protein